MEVKMQDILEVENYIEEVKIGNISVCMDTNIYQEYRTSFKSVKSMDDLVLHCKLWCKMSYELSTLCATLSEDDFDRLMEFRDASITDQNNMLEQHKVPSQWGSFILPINFLPFMIVSSHFHIPDGLGLLRLFHVGRASIDDLGFLRIDRQINNI
jgi:hypothetical protein